MGPSKATVAETRHMSAVQALGCIVCRREHDAYSPAVIHHIVSCGKRLGHYYVLPLCPRHHNIPGKGYETRHTNKAAFEAAYGTEEELLEHVRQLFKSKAA